MSSEKTTNLKTLKTNPRFDPNFCVAEGTSPQLQFATQGGKPGLQMIGWSNSALGRKWVFNDLGVLGGWDPRTCK